MSETVWVALITGGFTIGASLLATLLTQRHASRMADRSMREDRRREVRALLVQLTDAGRRWVSQQQIMIPAIYKSGLRYMEFFTEFPETDAGKQLGADNATISRVGGELLLMVKDGQLHIAISDILRMHERFADEVNGKLIESADKAQGEGDFQVTLKGFRYVHTMESLFERVMTRGAELLRGDL